MSVSQRTEKGWKHLSSFRSPALAEEFISECLKETTSQTEPTEPTLRTVSVLVTSRVEITVPADITDVEDFIDEAMEVMDCEFKDSLNKTEVVGAEIIGHEVMETDGKL